MGVAHVVPVGVGLWTVVPYTDTPGVLQVLLERSREVVVLRIGCGALGHPGGLTARAGGGRARAGVCGREKERGSI